MMLLSITSVSADTIVPEGNEGLQPCESELLYTFRIIGYVIYAIKVLVPIIIIIMASVDFGKAMISGDDKDLKSSTTNIIKKIIIGVVVFFIPTLLMFVINLIDSTNEVQSDFNKCTVCVLDVTSDECKLNILNIEN